MQDGDQWTVSIYDQAIGYAALRGLARLNAAAGREQDRARWEDAAFELRGATNRVLWQDQPRRGFYRIHVHLQPDRVEHYELDEGDVIAIGNAAAIYYGLADPERARASSPRSSARGSRQARPSRGSRSTRRMPAGTRSRWTSTCTRTGRCGTGGAGARSAASSGAGHWRMARQHLIQVARDWATHPGMVREWESPWLQRNGADHAYVGAAAVMGQAVVQGLFGVDISGREVRLTPRLHDLDGRIRVYEPATDVYAAYEYTSSPQRVSAQYGTNSPTAVSVRLPVLWRDASLAVLDGRDVFPSSTSASAKSTSRRSWSRVARTASTSSGFRAVAIASEPGSGLRFARQGREGDVELLDARSAGEVHVQDLGVGVGAGADHDAHAEAWVAHAIAWSVGRLGARARGRSERGPACPLAVSGVKARAAISTRLGAAQRRPRLARRDPAAAGRAVPAACVTMASERGTSSRKRDGSLRCWRRTGCAGTRGPDTAPASRA